ncbi:MAG: glycosyltransferase family 39 protein, partial [Anaerolinea sp.]|nr:glycosyltransferase family 39 protein [Anaerolinea sp.]
MSSSRRELLLIAAAFAITRLILGSVGTAINMLLPSVEGPEYTHLLDGGPALDMWYRWDAGFYTSIATFGYDWFNERTTSADMAFLPVYPLLIHLASGLTPAGCALSPYWSTCTTIGGLLVSNLALLISAWLLFDLTKRRFDVRTAWRALFLLLITPNAIFLSGVYTESTFLLWCLLTFWLLERRRFYLALIPAGLACLTRSVGVALFPALLWAAWTSERERWLRLIAAGLPPALFAGYVLFMGLTAGDPLAYFQAYRSIWGRAEASPIEAF